MLGGAPSPACAVSLLPSANGKGLTALTRVILVCEGQQAAPLGLSCCSGMSSVRAVDRRYGPGFARASEDRRYGPYLEAKTM